MKILINTIPLLTPLTGVGKYTYYIARALATVDNVNDHTYYYGYYSKNLISFSSKEKLLISLKESILSFPFFKKIARRIKSFSLPWNKESFDVYFEPNFIPLPIAAKKIVVTVHDFSFYHYQEWHPLERVKYFQNNFWKNIEKANKIIFVSHYIKNEAINTFDFPPEKLTVIYHGIDKNIYRQYDRIELIPVSKKYSLPPHFVFFVGSIEPRKNLKNLLIAYLEMAPWIRKELKLVIAGYKGWKNEEIHNLIKKSGGDIKFIGYIPEEELGKLFNLAYLFVFPSFYEGFGFPPLEAMACGCPVIVSNTSSLPEICGDAAYYINPKDIQNITKAIIHVVENEEIRNNLIYKGFNNAIKFNWIDSAYCYLKIFSEILSS